MDRLTGIHAIREASDAGSPFNRILIAKGRQDTRVEEIVQLARRLNIPVRFEDRSQLDRLASSRDHQGVVAIAAARPPTTLESLLAQANKSKGQIGFIALLDGAEDTHTPGANMRTPPTAAPPGMLLPRRRA